MVIYRLVTENTVEERIIEVAQKKEMLDKAFVKNSYQIDSDPKLLHDLLVAEAKIVKNMLKVSGGNAMEIIRNAESEDNVLYSKEAISNEVSFFSDFYDDSEPSWEERCEEENRVFSLTLKQVKSSFPRYKRNNVKVVVENFL